MTKYRYLIICLMSISLITLEIVWTRIFSAEFFYTFAFLTLSLAILGLGLGALIVRLFRFINSEFYFFASLILSGLLALIGPILIFQIGLNFSQLFGSLVMVGKFIIAVGLLSSSFFFGGIALALLLKNNVKAIPRLYMADLLGAAAGVLISLLAMNYFGTPKVVFLCGLPLFLAALISGKSWFKVVPLVLAGLVFYLIPQADSLLEVKREERAPVIYKHWDALAKLKMYDFGGYYRGLNIDNVANSPAIPFDGDMVDLDTSVIDWDINVGYLVSLFDSCTFLSLGAGGGGDVLQALNHGATEIHAVEVIPHINKMMLEGDSCGYIEFEPIAEDSTIDSSTVADNDSTAQSDQSTKNDSTTAETEQTTPPEPPPPPPPVIRDSTGKIITLADYTGHIYSDPRLIVVSEDARAYVRRFKNKFDVIYSLSSNSWAAFGSGAFSLAENYLFTTEAFAAYWESLSDSGFMSMEHQVYMPRLVSEVINALTALGVEEVRSHIAVYDLPRMRRKLLLISKRPLTEELRYNAYGPLTDERYEHIHLLYPPPDSLKGNLIDRVITEGWVVASDSAKINLSPCNDDRPFVAQLGMWKNFSWEALGKTHQFSEFRGFPLSMLTIVIILLVVVVLIIPINLLPYFVSSEKLKAAPWLYFFAIGAGFMMLEVVLIQKYTLFIGASIYSIITVLLTMLLASGIGSRFSRRFGDVLPFIAIIVWLVLDIFLFGYITGALENMNVLPRALVAALLIFPLGFFMGMPFPKAGLRVGSLIDWGFAVNGAAAVFGSTLIILIAINYGFTISLILGGLMYLVAGLLISKKSAW